MPHITDEALMQCVKNDDLDKAAILYERYKKKLYQYFLFKNYHHKEKSEDGVQQSFYRLLKYRKSYKDGSNFKAWLYSIAANINHHHMQEEMRANYLKENLKIATTDYGSNDDYKAIYQIADSLPKKYREALIMSKFWDMKYQEIADYTNCSVNVVKVRVFRAMQILREAYLKTM